MIVSLFDYFMF